MVEKHRHCMMCGISVSAENEPPLCSQRCEQELEKRHKKQRYTMLLMILPIVALMAIIFLGPMLGLW